ncbi:hypothetical protein MAGR_72120 [Mycolicibacterium agri]|uniref:Uncharacterized protein n=1 Tax=Mycolicibacterium agri TaxID=36811 RepID=A0A7I9WDF7_MYCAG|nr:hypothetical protein MAGR_72120 [Mycolicibacterium agri]
MQTQAHPIGLFQRRADLEGVRQFDLGPFGSVDHLCAGIYVTHLLKVDIDGARQLSSAMQINVPFRALSEAVTTRGVDAAANASLPGLKA